MRRHRISEIEVESAMRSPEHLTSSIEGRMNAWVKLPDRFLRVTYKEENGELAVITAVKKKKGWG